MKIGIIGSGAVGRALGKGLADLGYEVKIGSRTPGSAEIKKWLSETDGIVSCGELDETASFGELVVLATAWSGTKNAIKLAGLDNLAGKILIDVTNPLIMRPGGPPDLALGHDDSGGEQVQRWAPRARVVKTLNIVGNASMVKPDYSDGRPTMYVCGNNDEAKKVVDRLLKDLGWSDIIDIGGIEGARELESLCILWVKSAIALGLWNPAFMLLRE